MVCTQSHLGTFRWRLGNIDVTWSPSILRCHQDDVNERAVTSSVGGNIDYPMNGTGVSADEVVSCLRDPFILQFAISDTIFEIVCREPFRFFTNECEDEFHRSLPSTSA